MAILKSRRVIFWDLPIDTSLWAVLSTISSPKGIIRASLFTTRPPHIPNPFQKTPYASASARCALIEFPTAASAIDYVSHIQTHKIFITGKRHTFDEVQKCRVQGYLAGSSSNKIDEVTSELLFAGRTRSLVIKNVTESLVYDLLTSFGTAMITNVKYGTNKRDGSLELVVEFASVIEAERIYQLICQGVYSKLGIAGLINPIFGQDSTTRPLESLHNGLVVDIAINPIEAFFNKPPYNAEQKVFERKIPGQPIWHRRSNSLWFDEPQAPSHHTSPPDHHDAGLQSWLLSLEKQPPITYKIIGHPGITLSRTPTTWQISPEDQLTLLMETTLHEKEYRKWWDDFFASKKAVNMRKWEEYGRYARQRRRVCARWRDGEGASHRGKGEAVEGEGEEQECKCEVCTREKEKCSAGWVPRVIKEWTAWKEHGTREVVLEDDEDLEIAWASSSSEADDDNDEAEGVTQKEVNNGEFVTVTQMGQDMVI